MEEIKRNKLLINLKYHNIEEFKISDSDSLILLSESDINNKYFFEIKDYLTSLKKDLLNHFNIKNFSILSDKFGGSYSILHIRYDSISIFTNSNYIGLFYTIFENNSILITDSLDLISSELNYKLNIKELNYRNEYLLESPFESIHQNISKIPGLYYIKFNIKENRILGYSWILEANEKSNFGDINIDNLFKEWLHTLAERGEKIYLLLSGGIDSASMALLLKKYSIPFKALCFSCKTNDGKIGAINEVIHAKIISKILNIDLKVIYSEQEKIDDYLNQKEFPLFWDNFIVSPLAYRNAGVNENDIVIDCQNMDSLFGVEYTSLYSLKKFLLKPFYFFYELLHRTVLHFHYYLKINGRFAKLNILKASQGAIKFPMPLFFNRKKSKYLNEKYNIPKKIISPNLINSTHLNCLFIFRLIRYYNFCEPAVRFRKIILKEKNIQLTWPASNSLIIKKLLFRPSKFKDIFYPKWQLYNFFRFETGLNYREAIQKKYKKELHLFLKENNKLEEKVSSNFIKKQIYFKVSDWRNSLQFKQFNKKGSNLISTFINKYSNNQNRRLIKKILLNEKTENLNARTSAIRSFFFEINRANWLKF